MVNEFLRDEVLLPVEPTQEGPSVRGVIGRDTDDDWICDGSDAGLSEKRETREDREHECSSSRRCSRSLNWDGSIPFFGSRVWAGAGGRSRWESSEASSVMKKDM